MRTTPVKSPKVNSIASVFARLAPAVLSAAMLASATWPSSAQTATTTQRRALFVYAGATMGANDLAVSNRLVTLGYRVQTVLDTASATAQAATNDLIVVSSTVGSGNLVASGAHKFLASTVPLINWESANLDDLRMTSTAGGQFSTQGSQTSVNVVRANHPLAGGLPLGTNVIYNSPQTMQYGIPLANAIVIARQVGNDSRAVLFAYERDDVLFGGTIAAERRIALPMDNTFAAANTNGIALFDAAVRWANPTNPAPVFVSEPQDSTVAETRSVSFSCEVNGARPFTFQWLKNNTPIDGATSRSLTFAPNLIDNGSTISVRVTNASGSITSRAAKLTVTEDKSAPTVVSVVGSPSFTDVTIKFSKPLLPATATNLPNYAFFPAAISATGAKLSADRTTVVLTTTPQTPGAPYTLRIFSVRDATAALTSIAGGTEVNFSAWVLSRGALLYEVFNDISGNTVADLIKVPKFVNNTPDSASYISTFNTRTDDLPELMGARVSGYFTPPSNGLYRFFIRSDDASQLFMNTNSANSTDASKKVLIAKEDACCNGYGSTAAGGPRVSPDISLAAGQRYYIEALLKEGTGGDYVQVAVREKAVSGNPPDTEYIPGVLLSSFANPDGAAITVTEQPQSVTVTEGGGASATFTVAATAVTLTSTNQAIAYQWQKNGVDIAGANASSYTTAAVPSNSGAKYRALLMIPGREISSQEATLSVAPDKTSPSAISANTYTRQDKVTVTFSETVSDGSATKTDNYAFNNGVRVTSAIKTAPNMVELGVTTAPVAKTVQAAPGGPAPEVTLLAIDANQKWRYENTGKTSLGTAWKDKNYDDSAWPQGSALFGINTDNTHTNAGPLGVIRTPLVRQAGGANIVTDYFRTHFNFTGDPGGVKLSLRHIVDDGIVVYLNGVEIYRFGVAAAQTAATTAGNHEADKIEGPFDLSASALVAGDNVLAVELHQQSGTSSDAVFGLELKALPLTAYRIGLNFGSNEARGVLAATNVAGVVAQANWNNLDGQSGSAKKIVGDDNLKSTASPVTVDWGSNNTWASTGRGEENNKFATNSADRILMTGYLDTGAATTTTVTIGNIPPVLTSGGYDVYVYILGGVANKGGGYRILDAATKSVLKGYVIAQCSVNPTNHVAVPVGLPPGERGTGTYIVFAGLSAPSITIEATTDRGLGFGTTAFRAPVNAVQIVPSRPAKLGLNFGSTEASSSLTPKDVAGVDSVAQANWNNLAGRAGTTNKVVVDVTGSGVLADVTVTWAANNTWASIAGAAPPAPESGARSENNNGFPTNSPNRVLMRGYLDTGSTTTTSVTISNIPPQLASGGYDVYVYLLGGGGAPNRGGAYRIVDAATGAVLRDYVLARYLSNPNSFVQVPILPVPQYGAGTHIIFSGLGASAIRVEATTVVPFGFSGTPRAPINAIQLVTPSSAPPASGDPLPTAGLRLTINGVQDLAELPNTISAGAQLLVSADAAIPAEFGQVLSAYQDDFSGATLNPNWKARGPSPNLYTLNNGVLRVVTGAGDPNHLLYEAPGYNATNQEVLARVRIVTFGPSGDGNSRAGVGVAIGTNSQGINLHFRDANQSDAGTTINGRQLRLLDDLRNWGPGYDFRPVGANRWVTNAWYWMRVKQQLDSASGRADSYGKVWLADGTVPEPADWQITWRYPASPVRAGFAGIAASVNSGVATFDVDYVLIKASGLNTIKVGGSGLKPPQALLVTAPTPSTGDAVVSGRLASLGYQVTTVGAPSVTTGHASGKDVIVVSSSVSSGDMLVGGVHKFRDVAVPLMNYESANYDDLALTGTASSEFGTTATQTSINIVNASHPLAGGLPAGTNVIFTSAQTITWGNPLANAIVVARPVGNNTQAVIFGYEQGDDLFGGIKAAERRLGFVLNDTSPTAANAATAALFDAAIQWLNPANPAPVIVSEPADTTVTENLTATFSAEVNGARPFQYQWFKNNAAIPGATSRALATPVVLSDNGAVFSVKVTNPFGTVTSRSAKVTVAGDKTGPAVVSAATRGNPTGILVTFSEPVAEATGLNPANYSVSGGVAVFGTFPGRDSKSVGLVTSFIPEGKALTLTVKDVTDLAATPNKLAPNPTTVNLNTAQGYLAFLAFNGIGGTGVADLTKSVKYQGGQADFVSFMSSFNTRTVYPDDSHDNYGAWISGYFIPPSNGVYRFFIRSDDGSQLYMSTNNASSEDPTKKVLIAREDACCNNYGATSAGGPRVSPDIAMNGGQRYWIEAYLKEGGGGDYLQVAVREKAVTGNPPNSDSIPGEYLSSPIASAPVSITAQPTVQTAIEQQSATFSVGVVGTPPYGYQWYRNGVPIAGANASTLTIPKVSLANASATYSVAVTNGFSVAATDGTSVTVIPDVTPPTLVSAKGSAALTTVTLSFSETVSAASASNLANYQVSGGLKVTAANVDSSGRNVILGTSPQNPGTSYTVTVSDVKDTAAAGNTIAARSSATFTAWAVTRGFMAFQTFNGIGGNTIPDLTNARKYIDNVPDDTLYLTSFNTRTVYPNDSHEGYGARMFGYLTPPSNGVYRFFIRSDDASQLFMNTNSVNSTDPAGKVLIAREDGCCNNYLASGNQTSREIALTGGQRYYIEALLKEGTGGDFFQTSFRERAVTGAPPNTDSIPGTYLSTFGNPDGATLTVLQEPESANVGEGASVTFKVVAIGSTPTSANPTIFYQWQKNGADVPGANGSSYTTTAQAADNGAKFRVVLAVPGRETRSAEAALNVARDTTPPALVSAGSYARPTKVTVIFSEAISEASATKIASYTINNNVAVQTAARIAPNTVELTTSAIAPGPFYVLTVSGVQDLVGNTIRARSRILIDTNPAVPTDFGLIVNGYQDDFTAPTLNPNWKARGPAQNIYSVTNGVLRVATATGDPNHLLYEGPYSSASQEVLARIRIVEFGTGDSPRAGIGAAVATNSAGINLHFRDGGGNPVVAGRHVRLLDDGLAWGPSYDFRPVGTNRWSTNTWYWLRLKYEVNTAPGQFDAFGKAWLADGTVPEPANWQVQWDRYPGIAPRAGTAFAGITASSLNGPAVFEVDYVLIKALGLPAINVESSAFTLLGSGTDRGDIQLSNVRSYVRRIDPDTIVLADEGAKQGILSITKIVEGVVIQFPASPGRAYRIQASNDLKTWTDVGSATGNSQGRGQFLDSDSANIEQRFYRTLSP